MFKITTFIINSVAFVIKVQYLLHYKYYNNNNITIFVYKLVLLHF